MEATGALLALLLVGACAPLGNAQTYPQPEQVHLSIGENVDDMVVTWVTQSFVNESLVEFGENGLEYRAVGSQQVFVDGGSEKRKLYIHRVTLSNLWPSTRYQYHVGSQFGWSQIFNFKTLPEGSRWSPRFAMYGDMGNKNARSMARLQEETQQGHFDMILHVGDMAYDMYVDNARVGDEFMRQIEAIAAYVPYMTCPGNHENAYNFSNYKARFSMPGGDGQGQFYSFNVGPVHFIFFNSEFYYFINYGWEQMMNQYAWLKKDLQEANKPENRAKQPWIIAMAHRPMYCTNSNDHGEHCLNYRNLIRVGIPIAGSNKYMFGPEDLFYENGVDMIVAAHEHSYERMFPVYNWTVCNGSRSEPYTNPGAPVHIVTGSAGCQEDTDPFFPGGQPWSAFHSSDYGYTRFQVMNRTHLYLEQLSDNSGTVIDRIWVKKAWHGAGTYNCHTKRPFRLVNGRFVQT